MNVDLDALRKEIELAGYVTLKWAKLYDQGHRFCDENGNPVKS